MRALFLSVFLILVWIYPTYAGEWLKLEPGLSYKKIELAKKKNSSIAYLVNAFKVNPKKFDLRPIEAKPETYASIRQLSERSGALVAVNANFFDPQGKPQGLILSRGETISPFKDISWWGVFYLENSTPHIVHSSQWRPRHQVTTAIQAGPRLVVNGKIPRLKQEASPKTAIGINKSGEVILVTTLYPLEIRELAVLMARPEEKGGLGCIDALNFDGGSSSQLYARVGSFELRLPSYLGVPVGLGVFRK